MCTFITISATFMVVFLILFIVFVTLYAKDHLSL